ncbi:MAG: CBS domain-containing protein [Betaproteobacteria bacterium]|nr:CBS domain-containing protein [Betaproteobacteria bacterium]
MLFAVCGVLLLGLAGLGILAASALDNLDRHRLRYLLRDGKCRVLRRILLERPGSWQRFISCFWLLSVAAAVVFFVVVMSGFGRELSGTVLAVFCSLFVLFEVVCRELGVRYAYRIAGGLIPVLATGARLFASRKNNADAIFSKEGVFESPAFRASDLEGICVEDVMTPRAAIEAIDLAAPWDDVRARLINAYHSFVPVYRDDLGNLAGILHMQRVVAPALRGDLSEEALSGLLQAPYFIPANTELLHQIRFFQENRQRLGLVIDEYGEILGLISLEDIAAEISRVVVIPSASSGKSGWSDDGMALVDGARTLREINREFGLNFPLDGPKTLNGLILEYFQDIPEAGVSLKIGSIAVEIVQTQDKSVKIARIARPPD